MKKQVLAGSSTLLLVALAVIFWFTSSSTTEAAVVDSNVPLCEITRGLAVGTTGEDVRCLQRYLNHSGFSVAVTGPGSSGFETSYFGSLTEQAVIRWQNANAETVLAPVGLTSGTGFWGSFSFARYITKIRIALGIS